MEPFREIYNTLREQLLMSLLEVNRVKTKKILLEQQFFDSPVDLVDKAVVPVLEEIGRGWENGKYSLSQIYMAGRICEEVVDEILPPASELRRTQPKMAIVTLEDYHLLGKRIVYSTLRASGFELINYGRMDTPSLGAKVIGDGVKILLISVLMLPSALKVRELRAHLDLSNQSTRIVVGGAPFRFNPHLWREVGADACGDTASDAVNIVRRLIEEVG